MQYCSSYIKCIWLLVAVIIIAVVTIIIIVAINWFKLKEMKKQTNIEPMKKSATKEKMREVRKASKVYFSWKRLNIWKHLLFGKIYIYIHTLYIYTS